MLYRELLRDSLDRIFETEYDHMKDSIESKVFGIGLESYTVGSNDFYIGYGASRGKIVTLDTGHFHPTEIVADKISSLLLFIPEAVSYTHLPRPRNPGLLGGTHQALPRHCRRDGQGAGRPLDHEPLGARRLERPYGEPHEMCIIDRL